MRKATPTWYELMQKIFIFIKTAGEGAFFVDFYE